MTTDDGLKLLSREPTDEMLEHAISKATAPMTSVQVLIVKQSMAEVWRTMFDKAANVHDSGDGVSLASISIGLQNFYDSQAHLHEGSNNTHSAKLIHVNEAMQFILRADAAILAEKGEV